MVFEVYLAELVVGSFFVSYFNLRLRQLEDCVFAPKTRALFLNRKRSKVSSMYPYGRLCYIPSWHSIRSCPRDTDPNALGSCLNVHIYIYMCMCVCVCVRVFPVHGVTQ